MLPPRSLQDNVPPTFFTFALAVGISTTGSLGPDGDERAGLAALATAASCAVGASSSASATSASRPPTLLVHNVQTNPQMRGSGLDAKIVGPNAGTRASILSRDQMFFLQRIQIGHLSHELKSTDASLVCHPEQLHGLLGQRVCYDGSESSSTCWCR